jgi:diguanylate cyclase (GGDEF)-like protein
MTDDIDATSEILKLELPLVPTVLIVDDDELVRGSLQELVIAAGFNARTAANGGEALSSLEEAAASIVITDVNMPFMDGLDLCRRIRERAWTGYVYIVLLTVSDDERDVLAGLDAGADDYISKRTSRAQITARLRTANRILALEYSLKNAVEQKRQLAMTDALTGVYNRRYFMRHFTRELKRTQRFGGEVALLLLDVDRFKLINDTYGHAVGDIVLKKLTKAIAKCLRRATDWCARLGGDEFAVVLEGADAVEARVCAEKLRHAVANTSIDTAGEYVRITVSVGVSCVVGPVRGPEMTVEGLLDQADKSLYASKAGGRNRVTMFGAADPASDGCQSNNQRGSNGSQSVSVSSVR